MYNRVTKQQIADALTHLRELFRKTAPSSAQEHRAQEKREVVTKNLLSNLSRTKEHPTLNTVLEVGDIFSLTLDGAHRLFGYELEGVGKYDIKLNGGRTHVIESYPFERDLLIDLPRHLGQSEVFRTTSPIRDLVTDWQSNIGISALDNEGWQQAGTFYVHVGTEDSLGSSIPPGATALVEPIEEVERLRPNPRAIYLLQFGHGYRCSRCVVTGGKLLLLTSGRSYSGPQEFQYPANVRIAGRIKMFAMSLPQPEYPGLRSLPQSSHPAPLIMPWEHSSVDRLLATKHSRFRRSTQEIDHVRENLESIFHTRVSTRTERRYRRPTMSQPHVDALLQLTVSHMARYTDALRTRRSISSDSGRYSLNTLLNARRLADIPTILHRVNPPVPSDRWAALRKQYVEWPMLLSLRFPELRSWDNQIIRIAHGAPVPGLHPPISAGSLILHEKLRELPDIDAELKRTGWQRPLYILRRGNDRVYGHLDRSGNQYILLSTKDGEPARFKLSANEIAQLNRVSGIAVPLS